MVRDYAQQSGGSPRARRLGQAARSMLDRYGAEKTRRESTGTHTGGSWQTAVSRQILSADRAWMPPDQQIFLDLAHIL